MLDIAEELVTQVIDDGHLDAIGYELYVKLLNEAVLTEKGETVEEKTECVVSLDFDANLPDRYVRSATQRMTLYKRISLIESRYDMEDMTDELLDRYGDLPKGHYRAVKGFFEFNPEGPPHQRFTLAAEFTLD